MRITYLLLTLVLAGCGGKKTCDLATPLMGCESGKVCEEVGGAPACADPVFVKGKVTDPASAPIAGALVTALDANDAPASGTAKTDATGGYELRVPTPRAADGTPVQKQIKLRAAASGFDTFPLGIRRSLPIELTQALAMSGKRLLESVQTTIVLFPVTGTGLGAIGGTVKNGAGHSGALVVVEGATISTGIADNDGAFEVFNLEPGTYTVRGYLAGVNLVPATVNVLAGARSPADLAVAGMSAATVSGNVTFVNASAKLTSVVMVPKAIFSDTLKRGEVPPGLRAPKTGAVSVGGAFMIEGVPDGVYKVLAAFENDQLVRDPDPGISGTQIVEITVAGAPIALPTSFKITQALETFSPGAADIPEPVAGNPTFVFAVDSSADRYTVELYDGKGAVILPPTDTPTLGTAGKVSYTYAGPALVKGEYYQWKAVSYRKNGTLPISTTEDLKGVFIAD